TLGEHAFDLQAPAILSLEGLALFHWDFAVEVISGGGGIQTFLEVIITAHVAVVAGQDYREFRSARGEQAGPPGHYLVLGLQIKRVGRSRDLEEAGVWNQRAQGVDLAGDHAGPDHPVLPSEAD